MGARVLGLGREAAGDPHAGPGIAEELDRYGLAARRRLAAGDDWRLAHGLGDGAGGRGERLGRPREHGREEARFRVGDGALGHCQPEQAVEHFGQPGGADHVATGPVSHRRDDAGTGRAARGHARGWLRGDALLAARTDAARQSDARRHRLDDGKVDVVVGVRGRLSGGQEHRAADAGLGIDAACRAGARARRARHARPAFAGLFLRGRRFGTVGLLPARRRQRRVRRRFRRGLGRLAWTRLQLGDAREQGLVLLDQRLRLREQLVDPPEQRRNQRLPVVLAEPIDGPGCPPELEPAGGPALNPATPSQTAAARGEQ